MTHLSEAPAQGHKCSQCSPHEFKIRAKCMPSFAALYNGIVLCFCCAPPPKSAHVPCPDLHSGSTHQRPPPLSPVQSIRQANICTKHRAQDARQGLETLTQTHVLHVHLMAGVLAVVANSIETDGSATKSKDVYRKQQVKRRRSTVEVSA